ncbi:nitroreductase family protein [Paenibacillus pasadenensis]|uniref:Nitroreductase family protein n=1 Tax=Paenibacillus pasadenensis TaxID=217090 RepID=A0A2N5N4T6_9BACL|nr:nitroreductase family protein [Paenibacillus pasadenensis]PLT45366.1 Nitroreductase family protein [Paenibacillus pasadenensis]
MSSQAFLDAIKNRRSLYAISKEKVVPVDKVQSIIEEAVKHTPSAFNSQSARVVVLFDEQSDKLWDFTLETLRVVTGGGEGFSSTEEKMAAFKAGYGTVLFFEDEHVVRSLQEQFVAYQDNFPKWSAHSNGMLQLVIWTALEAEGLGATLQHYNPLIDEQVQKEFNVPESWKLIAQMPFGKPVAPAGEKQFSPIEERVKVFK